MDYQALKTELDTDPLARGYAAMSDGEAAASLNAADRTVTQAVPPGDLHQAMDNLVNGDGVPIWEAAEAHKDAASAMGVAVRAALRLRDAIAGYPDVNVHSPLFEGQLSVLVGDGSGDGTNSVMTQAQADSLVALGNITISRAQELGLGAVRWQDVMRARAK